MPTVEIIVPANWRVVAGRDLGALTCQASTVGAALNWLTATHPQFIPRMFSRAGQLASWINVYLGENDVRHLAGLDTPIPGPASLTIVPALAGG